jgi:hypothetical protein
MKWQYNGCAPWEDIIRWCYDNLRGGWFAQFETIIFKDQADYMWFTLRWS